MDAQAIASTAQFSASAPRTLATSAKTAEQAKAIGKKFEAMFVTQMINHMFTDVDAETSYFGGGHAESMFRPMLTDEYGKMVANHGKGIGLADQISKVLLSHQEVQA